MAEAVESGASGSPDKGCPAPQTPKSSSGRSVPLLATPDKPPLEEDTRLPPGWRRKLSKRLLGSSAGTYDVYMFNPEGRRFRSCAEVERYVAEKGLESELDCYVFDFSTFGTNTLTLRARREAQNTPKTPKTPSSKTPKKSVKKKLPTQKVVAHKLIKQKSMTGKKKAAMVKKKAIIKKAPVKTFAQKLVVKMDFLTRKRSANESGESESDSSDDEGEKKKAASQDAAAETTVSNKKRKVDAKASPATKKTVVDKAASPRKTPKKGTGASSSEDTPVVNGNAKGDDIENTQTEEAMDSAIHGGGDEQNNNDEPEQEAASPKKRASSKTRKDSGTPLKEVNNAAVRHAAVSPSGRRGRSSSRDSITAQSPRRKSTSVYTDDEVSFHTPNKQKRSRLSKDSDRSGDEDAVMESPGDVSHGQVDGAAADTPPRRGRGRPRKDASEPETPKAGRGRPRKQVIEAMETESPAKQLAARNRRGLEKEQSGEGSAASGDNVSPTKRPRGRPKSQIQPVESDPESVNPQENAEPVVKKKRGRPRKSLPGSVEDSIEVNLEQSEVVKDSGNEGEVGEEFPVKRGRGRPRKFPRTPVPGDAKAGGAGLKTPAQIVQKRSIRDSKDDESAGESPTKRTPMAASKARVTDEPDDSITESPVRRSRGRPRKIPVVEFAEKRPRARPQREVIESREDSNVIVTTAEIHREQSDDDELPTLTFEGEQESPPCETNLHKEPPLLVLSSNITAYEDDSIEPDPELPVLVSMSPRKSARKPKPYFHKDFVSPTRKLISSYEQGRASTSTPGKKPKEEQTVKAVGTPKRGRPRKVSEPSAEQEQSVKTTKRAAKLSEPTDRQRAASESENGIAVSDQAAWRSKRTENGDTSDSSVEAVNKVKKVVSPKGTNLGGIKPQGVKEKVKSVQSVSAGVSAIRGGAVKGKTTRKVAAMEGVSDVGAVSAVPDAEGPPELMPMDNMLPVDDPVPSVIAMDPADREVLRAVLLDHTYTNSITYSLPPEPVEEPEPPVLVVPSLPVLVETLPTAFMDPERPILDLTEAPILQEGEAPVLDEPEAPVLGEPEAPVLEPTVTPVLKQTEAPVLDEQEAPELKSTEAPVLKEPKPPVLQKPEVAAPVETPVKRGRGRPRKYPRTPGPAVTKAASAAVVKSDVDDSDSQSSVVGEAESSSQHDTPAGTAAVAEPPTEPGTVKDIAAVVDKPQITAAVLSLTDESETAAMPATEQPQAPASASPVAQTLPVVPVEATTKPVAEEPKGVAMIAPVPEEPKLITATVWEDKESKLATTNVPVTEEPNVAATTMPVAEEPITATVPVSEEPKLAVATLVPEAAEPTVATTTAPVAEEPKLATTSVLVAEEPRVATTTAASADSPLFERFLSITPVSAAVEKPKQVIATSPMAKNLKAIVANSAVAGRLKAMTAVTADKTKAVTATVAGGEKPKAVNVVAVEQSAIVGKTVTESPKPVVKAKVAAPAAVTVGTKSPEATVTKVKAGVKRKANTEAAPTPGKQIKFIQDKSAPGAAVGSPSKPYDVKLVQLTTKEGKVSAKILPTKLGLSPGTLPKDLTTGVAGLVKPLGIKGTVIVRKNPKTVPGKKGLTSPKNSETSLAKLEKSLKGIKSQEKTVRITPKKTSHKGGEKMSPIKSKKGKLNLDERERAALLKHKKDIKGEMQRKKGLHGSPGTEKTGHTKAKKHALHTKHGEMVPLGLHKKGSKFGKNLSPDKHKKSHVGFKDGVKASPEMSKKGLHRLKDGHKHTPDKHKKSSHSPKEGDSHKKVISSHKEGDRTSSVKKSVHGIKDSERKTPDKPKKVTLSLKDGDKSPSEKPPKGILSVKDSDKPSGDKPLKSILTVKGGETTPSDKPLKSILSVKSSDKPAPVKPKKLSLTINTGEAEASAAKSLSESDQTKPSDATEAASADKTPDKSSLVSSKNEQSETKSPNGTRRVSIGAVEVNEIDQTKSPGPPSTSFDLASLAFAPSTPKLNKRRKSSDSKSPKVKKVGGTWSFTPLSKMQPVSPKTPTPEAPASTSTATTSAPKDKTSSSGSGPKSILKKS